MRINQVKNVCKLLETLVKYIPLNSDQLKRQCTTARKSSGTTIKISNTPHPPRDPPDNYQPESIDHKAFDLPESMPAIIFRPFQSANEMLGPDAAKNNSYKNPEYFAYHRYSFADLLAVSLKFREECQNSGDINLICESSGSDSGSGSASSSSSSSSCSSSDSSSDSDNTSDFSHHQGDDKPCP